MRRAINTLSRTRVGALAATLMATGVASTEGGASSASYVYSPPARASEARAAIALEAAKPRVRVPLSPLPRVIFVLGGAAVAASSIARLSCARPLMAPPILPQARVRARARSAQSSLKSLASCTSPRATCSVRSATAAHPMAP